MKLKFLLSIILLLELCFCCSCNTETDSMYNDFQFPNCSDLVLNLVCCEVHIQSNDDGVNKIRFSADSTLVEQENDQINISSKTDSLCKIIIYSNDDLSNVYISGTNISLYTESVKIEKLYFTSSVGFFDVRRTEINTFEVYIISSQHMSNFEIRNSTINNFLLKCEYLYNFLCYNSKIKIGHITVLKGTLSLKKILFDELQILQDCGECSFYLYKNFGCIANINSRDLFSSENNLKIGNVLYFGNCASLLDVNSNGQVKLYFNYEFLD